MTGKKFKEKGQFTENSASLVPSVESRIITAISLGRNKILHSQGSFAHLSPELVQTMALSGREKVIHQTKFASCGYSN